MDVFPGRGRGEIKTCTFTHSPELTVFPLLAPSKPEPFSLRFSQYNDYFRDFSS